MTITNIITSPIILILWNTWSWISFYYSLLLPFYIFIWFKCL